MYNIYTHKDEVGAIYIDQHNKLLVTGNYHQDSYFFNHSGRNNGTVTFKLYIGSEIPWYVLETEQDLCKHLNIEFEPSTMYLISEALDNACIALKGESFEDIVKWLDDNMFLNVYGELFDYKSHKRGFCIND